MIITPSFTPIPHTIWCISPVVLFLLVALAAPARAGAFLKIFGLVYLALGIYGFITIGDSGMTTLLGFLPVNGADNYLHIGLGILIFLAGLGRNVYTARTAAR